MTNDIYNLLTQVNKMIFDGEDNMLNQDAIRRLCVYYISKEEIYPLDKKDSCI